MPLIPLKQTVTIYPSGGMNEYGEPVGGTPYTLKCRVQEGVKLVRDKDGREVVSVAQIFFDNLVSISLNDQIEFTDENNVTHRFSPISIEVKRGLNGKPLLTVVNV